MKILSWNCQGLTSPLTVRTLKNWCWKERSEIVFVMESKIDSIRLEVIRSRCGFTSSINLSCSGLSGGMGLWWRNLEVDTISYSTHHILIKIHDDHSNTSWYLRLPGSGPKIQNLGIDQVSP